MHHAWSQAEDAARRGDTRAADLELERGALRERAEAAEERGKTLEAELKTLAEERERQREILTSERAAHHSAQQERLPLRATHRVHRPHRASSLGAHL